MESPLTGRKMVVQMLIMADCSVLCQVFSVCIVIMVTGASGCSALSVCSFPSQEELEMGASGSSF